MENISLCGKIVTYVKIYGDPFTSFVFTYNNNTNITLINITDNDNDLLNYFKKNYTIMHENFVLYKYLKNIISETKVLLFDCVFNYYYDNKTKYGKLFYGDNKIFEFYADNIFIYFNKFEYDYMLIYGHILYRKHYKNIISDKLVILYNKLYNYEYDMKTNKGKIYSDKITFEFSAKNIIGYLSKFESIYGNIDNNENMSLKRSFIETIYCSQLLWDMKLSKRTVVSKKFYKLLFQNNV
uniref:Uncharacterized protein n=1 Tax=viral metagenome TaxID=1070528 RepID=A0A6C0H6H3_9ZZZZ